MLTIIGEGEITINNYIVLGGAAVFVLAVAFLLYFRLRDSPANNLRRARKHHALGEKYYDKGNHEEARLQYEIAKEYRERALKGEE